ncbi:uncharacterized protein LOC113562276 [Ooceraea biroi]|uniref:uncharacterized protein LOC113562276 n=1 Tax=Ooceraea biroi TaxID=2015173 RepID=UPI000F08D688|nr:uncharacterized protein LOC113562276 [Ooceraea biroi]
MKHLALLCIFMLFVHYSVQVPKYENCLSEVLPAGDRERCIKVTCTGNKYNIEECSCNVRTKSLHLGERHSEYPTCCPRCRN